MTASPYPLPREARESAILVGDGTVGPYGPSGYKVFDTADVAVFARADGEEVFTDVTDDCTITKTSAATYDTFSVTFDEAIPATTDWYHQSRRIHERLIAASKGGGISTAELEKELSKQATVLSENRRDIDRSLRVDPEFVGSSLIPALQDAETLVWDATAKAFKRGPSTADISAAQGYATAAGEAKDGAESAQGATEAALATFETLLGAGALTSLATHANLSGFPSALTDGQTVFVRGKAAAGDGGGGVFAWRAGDQSANVTADPGAGVWIPLTGGDGSTGAWQRVYTGPIHAAWYGAKFDSNGTTANGTDNLAAVHNALAFASTGGNGGAVLLPRGLGRFSGPIIHKYSFGVLQGEGLYATGIYADHSGDEVQFGDRDRYTDRPVVADLYLYQPTGSGYGFLQYSANRPILRNVWMPVQNGGKLGIAATAISNCADNGAGLIRVTSAAHPFETGGRANISDVEGTTEANGLWTVTKIDANNFDLQGSTFSNGFSAGAGNARCAPHNSNLEMIDCLLEISGTHGLDVYSHAGGVVGTGSSIIGLNYTGGVPTDGTVGLHFRPGTTAYARFDFITGFIGIAGFGRQIHQENTRVVNVELPNCLFDFYNDFGVLLENDTPDWTGAGTEIFNIAGSRFGFNGTAQGSWLLADASGVSCLALNMKGCHGTASETAVFLSGSAGVVSGVFDDLSVDLRPTAGSQSALRIQGAMGTIRANGIQASSTSATYGAAPVTIVTGATGDIIVRDTQASGFASNLPADADGLAFIEPKPLQRGSAFEQVFGLLLTNSSGIKHSIGAMHDATAAARPDRVRLINGASASLTATPTGADGSTAMAAGGKIGSANTGLFWFDVPAQTAADVEGLATIIYNDTGTAMTVFASVGTIDINGTSHARVYLGFYNATTGAQIDLTSVLASGKSLQLQCRFRLSS